MIPSALHTQLADKAVTACLNDANIPSLDISKSFVTVNNHKRYVTNDPFLWTAKLVIQLEYYLNKLPEQITFHSMCKQTKNSWT